MSSYPDILSVYLGSNGDATTALYKRLEAELGTVGLVAVNLFRAHKCSSRAKVYRGRRYRDSAYDRKQWSMDNLVAILTREAEALQIAWGWAEDPQQEFHKFILYVEIPTGQVSFHTAIRGAGPEYGKPWDGVRDVGPQRICSWIGRMLDAREAQVA
jgi:hypothetical protein